MKLDMLNRVPVQSRKSTYRKDSRASQVLPCPRPAQSYAHPVAAYVSDALSAAAPAAASLLHFMAHLAWEHSMTSTSCKAG